MSKLRVPSSRDWLDAVLGDFNGPFNFAGDNLDAAFQTLEFPYRAGMESPRLWNLFEPAKNDSDGNARRLCQLDHPDQSAP